MTELVRILYLIITALSAPVIIALLLLSAWVIFETGKTIREWSNRKKAAPAWKQYITSITDKNISRKRLKETFFSMKSYPWLIRFFAAGIDERRDDPAFAGLVISEIETKARKATDRMKIGIRISPILGLMGTLIPMGPALKGLTSGSLDVVSENLFIAFSTTVIGLLLGGICYIFFTVKKNWYTRDLMDIEFIIDNVLEPVPETLYNNEKINAELYETCHEN